MKTLVKPKLKYRSFVKNKSAWVKVIATVIAIMIPTTFIGAFAYRDVRIINFEGSSTMKPLIDVLTEKYLRENAVTVDINVQSGGSGSGFRKALSGQTKFGNYSDDVSKLANANLEQWNNKQMKTMTIAWDGIGLLYLPPKGCTKDLVIKKDNVNDLYKAFSGYNTSGLTLKSLIGNGAQEACNVSLIAYPRTGGAKSSGTASAFLDGNHLLKPENFKLSFPKSYEALTDGKYGNEIRVTQTNEPNSSAYDIYQSNKNNGSLIYLSIAFILNNYNSIIAEGYKLAGFQKEDIATPTFLTKENFGSELGSNYLWFRPLNVLVSLIGIKDYEKEFINWIYLSSQKSVFQKEFYGALSDEQYKTMTKNGNFWVPDSELGNKHGAFVPEKIIP